MADQPSEQSGNGRRRGLSAPSIQRGNAARVAIRTIRLAQRLALQALEVLLAIVILFEEWGWQPLSNALARLAQFNVFARFEIWVRSLPPWGALAVFLVPSLLFFPLKLGALWLITGGHVISATVLFGFAKVAGTALYARIFQLTQPALMQLAWFARLYNWFVPWKDALVERVKATPVWRAAAAVKGRVHLLWLDLKPTVLDVVGRLRQLLARAR